MDVFRYINSKDIRDHLRKLDYRFNSLETAWLVYECRHVSIEEKHKAWMELIETMPDCHIPERLNTVAQPSLHQFLKRYMKLENKYIAQFCEDNNLDAYGDKHPCFFQFEYAYSSGDTYTALSVISSFLEARKSIIDDVDDDVTKVYCTKTRIDDLRYESTSRAVLTPKLEFLEIEPHGLVDGEDDIFNGVFEGLWFDFPTPFKKGDIVWNPCRPDLDGVCGGPLVVCDICLGSIDSEKRKDKIRKLGDTSDMNYAGYFVSEDIGIYSEVNWNYMDLEYYDKNLIGTSRTLIALSRYLKGKIDIGLFARAYHQIMSEEYAKRCMPRDYTEEGLKLAGLLEG